MRTSKKISILICLALCFVALLALTACTGGGGSTEGEHVHTEEIIPGVEATCTEDGLTEGKKCSDCGEILVEQKKKDAVGKHKFENSYTCTLCNTEIYKESQGLLFEISGDNTYYIVVGIGDCADTEIVIPYTHEGLPVLAIGDSAFLNRNIITAVIIPESVTTIGNSAFSGCVALVSVSIPDSVNEIRSNAFSGCILLEIVTIGSNVSIIGDNAFSNCDKLEIYCEQQSKPDGWSESWNTSSRPVSWEHTHTEEIIPAVESTCSKEGLSEGKKCSDCGKILLEQKPLRKKDHTEKKVPAVEPTCYKSGLTEGIKCSVCGEVLVAQETIAPHKEEIIPAVEPTCTETGLTEGKKCADCGKILEPQEIIAPHKEEIIPAVAATCTQTGLTEGKKCADCGEILVEQKVVPMGHKLENSYTCTLCGIEIYKESQGLEFEISKDGTYYVLSGLGDCTDTDIVIPYTHEGLPVKDIHYTTFQKNASITSIIIPSSITSISGGSFNYCSSLTSVRIPNSVTLMGYDVFRGCVTLTIYCEPTSKPQGWDKYWNETNCPVVWNSNNNDIATDGNVYTVIDGVRYAIKDGVATVARQSSNIASATISSSITYRGINYNVTGIDENAFYDCSSLTKISIPNSIVSIGDKAFYGCPLLEYNEYDNAYYLGNEENPCVALMKAKDTNITSCTINEN
ncbi:MAG: leucine-rich repeat protein, partial [Clostridia bacterium]|nr:leucine-rich repeat protein [Clostridia bacterium]